LNRKNELVRNRFRATTREQARIIARGSNLTADQKVTRLEAAARQLSDRLAGLLNRDYLAAGEPFSRLHSELREKLEQDVESLTHDFQNNTAWGEPLASEPAQVTNINVRDIHGPAQIGATGAVQHQIVVLGALPKLIQEIAAIQVSPEVAALNEDGRTGINEVAEDLMEEASSPTPDPARLRRWGERLLGRLHSAGLIVAEEALKVALFAALTAPGAL
jgi:hypothetical protein